ncbi:hypothetical protein CXB51_013901 [Gossypium anomalum]|uniref:Transcription initiation factor IIF subunit alpha n=1 Tax=Gossypium anomalum TaxID=47600 RepID=A0A8J6D494_9ROSI|nr:hypothetical protein CXB51_013901 [Gossypium anomalum]
MSFDLMLKPSCSGCGSSQDLYGSNCKHMTLCVSCGKTMAENQGKCFECGAIVTRLIRVHFPIFTSSYSNSSFDNSLIAIGFMTGLPNFSKKKNAENRWSLQKDGLQGRQVTDALREKYKNKPWLLEDETGQAQYQGQLEGSQSATYYLLMMQGKEFVAIPAGSWYNFNKVAQYKQLTLEEAEEKMKNRRKTADGYERWMMKAANNGAAAFGEVEKIDEKETAAAGGRGRKKSTGEEEEGHVSDRGEEDEEEEAARKNRLGLNKKSGDDDEEGPRGGDLDMDDDDIEKGDDWEHEEIFTDDDEAVGNDPEERDLAPEVPAPPEIKEDEDEEDEEQEGGLSKSGKELKKLLGKASGLNDSDAEEDDDDEDVDDDMNFNPTPAPKQKDAPKEEPADNSPMKPAPSASARGTPATSKSSKGKRKGDDTKASNGTPLKKVKSEPESKTSVKEENTAASKGSAPSKGTSSSAKAGSTSAASASSSKAGSASTAGPVTEEEIRAVLLQKAPVTTSDLVAKFKARLKSPEDKKAFADILRRISKIQKTNGPNNYVVLREK